MIYVDSNVPMYFAGGPHANKERVRELIPQLLSAREVLVTSAETYQELLHRYLARHDRHHLAGAWEVLDTLVTRTAEVTKQDVADARALSADHPRLSSRDCLHVAIMRRLGCAKIWSFDAGFDAVPSLLRIQ